MKLVHVAVALAAVVVLFGVSWVFLMAQTSTGDKSTTTTTFHTTVTAKPSSRLSVMTTTKGGSIIKYVVPPEEILPGGPPKDGIPSIDDPLFVTVEEADFLSSDDLVVGIYYNGVAKAYPHKILVWHEIVNDLVADLPVAITYCPLCYTATAFVRVVEDEVTTFGVSGRLYNSDLVMYDRRTDTYWSQHWGVGIMGPLAGTILHRVQVDVMPWFKWKQLHPNTLVLSTTTGFSRPYGHDPYGGYYRDRVIWFPVKNKDDRLHPKAIVYGAVIDGAAKVYEQKSIARVKVLNDIVNETPLVVVSPFEHYVRAYSRRLDNMLLDFTWEDENIVDVQTKSRWNMDGVAVDGPLKGSRLEQVIIYPAFWFAWSAFYPGLELYYDGGETAYQ